MKAVPRVLAIAILSVAVLSEACSRQSAPSPTAVTSPTAATSAATSRPGPCGSVNLALNGWVGYEANAAVVGYLLQHELGCTVALRRLDELASWQGLASGSIEAILENWDHDSLARKYITADGVAQDAGPTGDVGVIGWFVPKFFVDANPDILTAKTNPQILNKYADQFKTPESGDKGQVLDGDPEFVTDDKAMINGFELNYRVVYSGSEAASDAAIQAAIDQHKPILAYYYTPNWFSTRVDLVHVELPAHTAGCDSDPNKIACDYPIYQLNKIVSTKFATSGSPAYELIKNFNWTNDDQDRVAASITDEGLSDDAAAKKWLDANTAKWQAWLPK